MMTIKKYLNYFIRYISVIVIIAYSFLIIPTKTNASSKATTLAELKAELKDLETKYRNNEYKKNLTKAEINAKNVAINEAHSEIEKSENNIATAKAEIENTQTKITELNEQTNEIMAFYQLMNGDNAYLQFVSDSASMTDLIMRIDAIEQLATYNKNKLAELDSLIKTNEQKQVDLKNYEKQLQSNITTYEQKIAELDSSMLELSDISVSIEDEIKIQKSLIKMYEDAGCKDSDRLAVCISYGANTGWLKPVSKAYVSSLFGYRILNGKSSNHSGIDLGMAEGTTVYSSTNGRVISIIRTNCGGNQVYVQSLVAGKKYTLLYAHLLSVSVKEGQNITTQTVIGKSGGYSTSAKYGGYDTCTFGAHLHLSVSEGYYTEYPARNAYKLFVAHLINPPGYPGKGAWFYSRTQWFG